MLRAVRCLASSFLGVAAPFTVPSIAALVSSHRPVGLTRLRASSSQNRSSSYSPLPPSGASPPLPRTGPPMEAAASDGASAGAAPGRKVRHMDDDFLDDFDDDFDSLTELGEEEAIAREKAQPRASEETLKQLADLIAELKTTRPELFRATEKVGDSAAEDELLEDDDFDDDQAPHRKPPSGDAPGPIPENPKPPLPPSAPPLMPPLPPLPPPPLPPSPSFRPQPEAQSDLQHLRPPPLRAEAESPPPTPPSGKTTSPSKRQKKKKPSTALEERMAKVVKQMLAQELEKRGVVELGPSSSEQAGPPKPQGRIAKVVKQVMAQELEKRGAAELSSLPREQAGPPKPQSGAAEPSSRAGGGHARRRTRGHPLPGNIDDQF
eukprot:RCo027006